MKLASIDIGTNTILLLIVEVLSGGKIKVLHDEQVIARLGKGVDADRIINQETFTRAEDFLRAYKHTCSTFGVDKIFAVGTSALRDAKNSNDFANYIYEKIGIRIEIISGDEEAELTYRGGISEFIGRAERYSVFDIGGGSTEIIVGNWKNIIAKTSVDIGSVRITERILKNSPPDDASIIEAHEFILSQIHKEVVEEIRSTFVIGVAGTLTTLAALHQKLPAYLPEKVSGYSLSFDDVCALFAMLRDRSVQQISLFPQISPGRADIILAGIMILMGCMEKSGIDHITVSDRGLRYGIIYREMERASH